MKKMFVTYVRHHLDYCSQLWAPTERPKKDKLEKFQYYYTSIMSELRNLTYEDRLKKMCITSLQRRYDRYHIFYMWKLLHGIVPNFGIKEVSGVGSRQGLNFEIPKTPENRWGTLKDKSFQILGSWCWSS